MSGVHRTHTSKCLGIECYNSIHLLQTVPHPGTDCITLTHHALNMELLRMEFERIDNGDECAY